MQQEALLVYLVGDTFSHQQTISGWLHTAIRCSLTYSFPKFMILLANPCWEPLCACSGWRAASFAV